MSTTHIKVPSALRDRLAARAKRDHTTLAMTLERALDAAEEAEFWARARATMGDGAAALETSRFDATARDGLGPDERWDDIL